MRSRFRPGRCLARLLCGIAVALVAPSVAFALDLSCAIGGDYSQNAVVNAQVENGETYLFLPTQADLSDLSLFSGSGEVRVWSYAEGAYVDASQGADLVSLGVTDESGQLPEGGGTLLVQIGDSTEEKLTVMTSANIRSVFVNTDHDRSYVDSSRNHTASDAGQVTVFAPDSATPIVDSKIDAIRGRGNSTWSGSDKKPYQMKLSKKADLLGTGEKTKTWLLIANAGDPTLLRNTISYKLALYMGSAGTPSCEPCDLYYNGEYRGSYLLTEKVKVEKNGVNIDDLDEANEDANAGSSAWENPWASREWSTNDRGADFSYVSGLSNPDDITGGYLVELDDRAANNSEISMFYSKTHFFTVHTPESATYDEAKYVSELVGAGVDAAISGGTDPLTGRSVFDLFDMDTLLATGLTEDFVQEGDYLFSSTYFYVPRASGKVYCGPVWDCDRSFNLRTMGSASTFAASFLSGNSELLAQAASVFRSRLYPVVSEILLGDASAQSADGSLRSLAYYRDQIAASQAMDQVVWGIAPLEDEWTAYERVDGKEWSTYVDGLATYMTGRLSYMDGFYGQTSWKYCTWRGSSIDTWVPYLDGKAVTDGWVLDGFDYYYMSGGHLQTGWVMSSGSWYFLDYGVGIMRTGWLNRGGTWYYLDFRGKMRTRWVWDGAWYYFDDSGAMQTGWVKDKGDWYYLQSSGAMATGWQNIGGAWYWLDDSGAMATGWQNIGGTWYWLGGDGAMRSGWQCIGGSWYWFDGSGAMATGWTKVGGSWYLLSESGDMLTGWHQIGGVWYWLDDSGVMVTGWQNIGGWYWFDDSGAMATGFVEVDGARYHFSESGAMSLGWFEDVDSWYFADGSGVVASSRWVGNYYLLPDGRMATSQWVGYYYVGPSGAWEPGAKRDAA